MATGFNFGSNPTGSGGFSFGNTGTAPGATTNQVVPATTSTGFSFGTQAKTTSSGFGTTGGFNFANPITTTTSTSTGLLGGGGFTLNVPAVTTSSNFVLGGTSQPSTGFFTGANPNVSQNSGFNLGGLTTTSAATKISSAPTLGLVAPITSTGASLGGLLGTSTTTSAPASVFNTVTTSSTSLGLGGVDPKTSLGTVGSAGQAGKSSDGKALKETMIPGPLLETVDNFQKHVKNENAVRDSIARMSTKPMLKAQEDVAVLKQLLAVVSNGLQRNACAVEKLKREMTQEMKSTEMAQRTKDIPDGLQYENTAPTLYFQQLVEEFESLMLTYRQQIENLENHLAALHQPARHTPAELVALMLKLHETFIALAAQLQQVHEAVKNQKEHYLNYRKIFHGDSKNIFERHKKPIVRPQVPKPQELAGPNPFTGSSNAAAVAMASILNRSQQPAGAPPVVGLSSGTLGGGTGLSSTSLGGGSGLFGANTTGTAFGTGGSLFSNTSNNQTSSMGFGFGLGAQTLAGATPATNKPNDQFNLSASTNRPFQLTKPPVTAKRGRR